MPERFDNAPFTNGNSSADPFQATDKFSEQGNGAGFDPLVNPGQAFIDKQVNPAVGTIVNPNPKTPAQFFYNNNQIPAPLSVWTGPLPSASAFGLVDGVDNFGEYITSESGDTFGFQPFS